MNKEQYNILTPPYLKQGDKIGLISTARKISKEELQVAIEHIESWGLKIKFGKNLFNSYHQFSANDNRRAKDLQTMLDDDNIKAIICARGGYGTVRLIDKINFSKFQKTPKWIVGFSDVTVLHSHIHNLKIASLHSTMPVNFSNNNLASIKSLKDALFGKSINVKTKHHPLNRFGESIGQVVGGNLSILYSLIGSTSDINTDGKILFLEDIDEYLYHIDRMMISLKRSGKLSNLKGLIIGGMTKMNDNKISFGKDAESIIFDTVSEFNYPMCFEFPAGHIKNNKSIKLGLRAKLKVDKKCSLSYF
tara:strand:- start:5626 stop:6540 length:915 start_codon:yes stop_codon:yes gene_type:complete